MAKVCLLLTGKPWNERRYFHRHGPGILAGGHEVIYTAGRPTSEVPYSYNYTVLSQGQRKLGRPTGTLNLLPKILRLHPDLLLLPSFDQIPLGLAIKSLSKIRVVYDCIEDMYHGMRDHKSRFPSFLRKHLANATKRLEKRAATKFDGIIASDPTIAAIHAGMPAERKTIVYNTPLLSQFPLNYDPLAKREYDLVVMGSMSPRTGVVDVVDAVGILKNEHTRFVRLLLLGNPIDGAREMIEERIERYNIHELVHITGFIPHEQIPAILSNVKIGLVPLPDMPKFRNNIACKAFEYMACGMPSICTDLPPQRLFIKPDQTGVFYEAGSIKQLTQKIIELLDNPSHMQNMGDQARTESERHWNCERDQDELRRFIDKILNLPLRQKDHQ